MGNLLSLKSIILVFKIDLKSIFMDSQPWKIDGDPWNLNPGIFPPLRMNSSSFRFPRFLRIRTLPIDLVHYPKQIYWMTPSNILQVCKSQNLCDTYIIFFCHSSLHSQSTTIYFLSNINQPPRKHSITWLVSFKQKVAPFLRALRKVITLNFTILLIMSNDIKFRTSKNEAWVRVM